MKRKNDSSRAFLPSDEVLQNPYIGFTSFNHFRGEPLFSDTTKTDGWIKEHYPVYKWVEQKGNKQGYYPDTEVAYIRIVWRDFEPIEGEYNFALTDDILAKAKKRRQSLMIRIMPHTTRENEDVPDWLKQIIDCPTRPTAERVKDSPKDVLWIEKFGKAIEAFAKRYDEDKTLYAVDISLTGAWGEGHKYEEYPQESLRWLIDIYTKNFKNTHLLGQICAPELVRYARQTKPIGWRADGLGNLWHMNRYYPELICGMDDAWKTAPVSFETFWYLNEWKRQGWDIDEIIEQTLKWHISSLNGKSSAVPLEWKDKIDGWLKKMGYRFAIRNIEYPATISRGDEIGLEMWLENRGVAPIYEPLPFKLHFKNEKCEFICPTEIDVRGWLPGDTIEKIEIVIPKNLPIGNYKLYCELGGGEYPHVQFAMQTKKDGWLYYLADITIVE